MRELAACLAATAPRAAVLDRRRKLDAAAKLQQRWQRWELSNFDYLMQACACAWHHESSWPCI